MWSGRESDRASAICQFCDTQFVGVDGEGGGNFEIAEDLAEAITGKWPGRGTDGTRFVVCTGGEPLLQLDRVLIDALHEHDFEIAVETNGTVEAPAGIDWICVSPKAGAPLVQKTGDELKLVFPQVHAQPAEFEVAGVSEFFPAANGWARANCEYRAGSAVLPGASQVEAQSADAQDCGNSLIDRCIGRPRKQQVLPAAYPKTNVRGAQVAPPGSHCGGLCVRKHWGAMALTVAPLLFF